MRQVVLVVVLVTASFLGGAFVNGPGLRWAQTQLLGSLGLSEGEEIASVDLKATARPEPTAAENPRPDPAGPERAREPLAPVPSLVSQDEGGQPDASPRRSARPGGSRGPIRPAPPESAAASPSPPPLAGPTTAPPADPIPGPDLDDRPVTRAPRPATARPQAPARLDPNVTPVAAAMPAAAPDVAGADEPGLKPPALLSSLASLMPSAPPTPRSEAPVPAPAPVPTESPESPPAASHLGPEPAGDDWTALGRKMQALGVSHFTIEGQPGGRTVFSCLIPLAGRHAVAQRFEAEGADGFRAARAALRRVALWQATQPSSSSP